MNVLLAVIRLSLRDALRGRLLPGVLLLLAVTTELLLRFGGAGPTTLVSLIDVVLIITPLVGLVAGTMQVHQARETIELLLAQPVSRRLLFTGLYIGNVVPLALAAWLGLAAPFAWHLLLFGPLAGRLAGLLLVALGLTCISSALAFLVAMRIDDRVRAIAFALGLWFLMAVAWAGMLLMIAMLLGDGVIEPTMLALLAINPVDLGRVLLLLGSDAAALLGYTGAVVQHAIGSDVGRLAVGSALALWFFVPLGAAARAFQRKSF